MSAYSLPLLASLLIAAPVLSGAATLTLDNSTLYGLPGQTVGFGFTITSTPDPVYDAGATPYLVIASADFVAAPGTYPVGVFTPFITKSFTVIGPPAGKHEVNPFSQFFNEALRTGIGSYAIDSFQSVGDQATGDIVLTYDEYSVSPNSPTFDPSVDTLANGLLLTAPATVIVGSGPTSVPEPAAAVWILPAIAAALLIGRLSKYALKRHGILA